MASAAEALAAKTQLGAGLAAGTRALSNNQEIVFTKYRRLILPTDGYVFWVRAASLGPSALLNSTALGLWLSNQAPVVGSSESVVHAMGSLHYATDQRQEESSTYAFNRVVFTAEKQITDLNQLAPDEIYIGIIDGIKFAFGARGSYYHEADVHHYVGNAVYPFMDSQVVEDPRLLNTKQLIVSNSLPAWLALNGYVPAWPTPLPQPAFQLYPSFLVPANLPPPYGSVHIEPNETEGLQAASFLSSDMSSYQLARDKVTVTLYGCTNELALTFKDSVIQYALDKLRIGVMNVPVPRDDKQTQNELNVIAQRKRIVFEVCYYQSTMRDVARQMIEEASITVTGSDVAIPFRDVPISITGS